MFIYGNKINKKALSLTEVLWAVAILGLVIVLVTGVFTGILVSSKKSEKLLVATNLATRQREHIKSLSFDDVPPGLNLDGKLNSGAGPNLKGEYFPPYPAPQPMLLQEKVEGITYYYKIKTDYVPGSGNNLISVVITVYWDETKEKGKNYISLELFKVK